MLHSLFLLIDFFYRIICPPNPFLCSCSLIGSSFSFSFFVSLFFNREQSKAPTATSDRVCRPATRVLCGSFAGMGSSKRSVLSLDPKNTGGQKITAWCKNDGTYLGGDGSSRLKAGKSCATIRHFFAATKDGVFWTFMNDTGTPTQVYCDMNSCGNDAAIAGKRWGNRVKDLERCGGWTMAFKWPGQEQCSSNGGGGARDCWKMNRNNVENYKWGKVYGSHTTIAK